MTFNPNLIRADIESQVQRLFDPAAFDPAIAYDAYSTVLFNESVWITKANQPAGAWDPAGWINLGPAYPVLFSNVTKTIPEGGAVRVAISWGQTTQTALACCPTNSFGQVDGVLTLFSYTPAQEGTRQGLNAASRLRDAIPVWERLPDVSGDRPCYRVSDPNGPRGVDAETGRDFYTHNLTATLTAQDSGSPLA